jgi:hypothetical protein
MVCHGIPRRDLMGCMGYHGMLKYIDVGNERLSLIVIILSSQVTQYTCFTQPPSTALARLQNNPQKQPSYTVALISR